MYEACMYICIYVYSIIPQRAELCRKPHHKLNSCVLQILSHSAFRESIIKKELKHFMHL